MKILMIAGLYYPIVGGAERECQKQAESLNKKGIPVMVLTQHINRLPEYEEINGVPVYRKIKAYKPWGPTYILSVIKFLIKKRKKYDIIQCFGIYFHTIAALCVRSLFHKVVINRLEGTGEIGDLETMKRIKYGFLISKSWKKVDKFVAISREIAEQLGEEGLDGEKVTYIPNSVDIDLFCLPSVPIQWDSRFNLLYVGRLVEGKGGNTLLESLKKVVDRGFKVHLFVVGDGPLRRSLERLAFELEISPFVSFEGMREHIVPYYHNSHILVLPSRWEGLSLVLLEGMACGLPIIASDLGGNREGIEDGINGLLFAPEDKEELSFKIIYLLEHPEIAKEMGRISRKKAVDYFSLEKNIHKYVELYNSLLIQ